MTRTEKRYSRLTKLEQEYLSLIRKEFQGQSDGLSTPWVRHRSRWLRSMMPLNRTVPDDQTKVRHIDRLERDIVAIRRGLGEIVPGHAVAIPQELFAKYDALGVFQTDGDWLRLVRNAIARIDAIQNPASPSD